MNFFCYRKRWHSCWCHKMMILVIVTVMILFIILSWKDSLYHLSYLKITIIDVLGCFLLRIYHWYFLGKKRLDWEIWWWQWLLFEWWFYWRWFHVFGKVDSFRNMRSFDYFVIVFTEKKNLSKTQSFSLFLYFLSQITNNFPKKINLHPAPPFFTNSSKSKRYQLNSLNINHSNNLL